MSLDLPEPVGGWEVWLEHEGIDVMEDDCGRPAIARKVLGALVHEHTSRQKLMTEQEALRIAEQAEIERRTPVRAGVPAVEGLSAMETMAAADGYVSPQDEWGYGSVTRQLLDEQFAERDREAAREKARLADEMQKDLGGKGKQ